LTPPALAVLNLFGRLHAHLSNWQKRLPSLIEDISYNNHSEYSDKTPGRLASLFALHGKG
jgi:hypothetical protein